MSSDDSGTESDTSHTSEDDKPEPVISSTKASVKEQVSDDSEVITSDDDDSSNDSIASKKNPIGLHFGAPKSDTPDDSDSDNDATNSDSRKSNGSSTDSSDYSTHTSDTDTDTDTDTDSELRTPRVENNWMDGIQEGYKEIDLTDQQITNNGASSSLLEEYISRKQNDYKVSLSMTFAEIRAQVQKEYLEDVKLRKIGAKATISSLAEAKEQLLLGLFGQGIPMDKSDKCSFFLICTVTIMYILSLFYIFYYAYKVELKNQTLIHIYATVLVLGSPCFLFLLRYGAYQPDIPKKVQILFKYFVCAGPSILFAIFTAYMFLSSLLVGILAEMNNNSPVGFDKAFVNRFNAIWEYYFGNTMVFIIIIVSIVFIPFISGVIYMLHIIRNYAYRKIIPRKLASITTLFTCICVFIPIISAPFFVQLNVGMYFLALGFVVLIFFIGLLLWLFYHQSYFIKDPKFFCGLGGARPPSCFESINFLRPSKGSYTKSSVFLLFSFIIIEVFMMLLIFADLANSINVTSGENYGLPTLDYLWMGIAFCVCLYIYICVPFSGTYKITDEKKIVISAIVCMILLQIVMYYIRQERDYFKQYPTRERYFYYFLNFLVFSLPVLMLLFPALTLLFPRVNKPVKMKVDDDEILELEQQQKQEEKSVIVLGLNVTYPVAAAICCCVFIIPVGVILPVIILLSSQISDNERYIVYSVSAFMFTPVIFLLGQHLKKSWVKYNNDWGELDYIWEHVNNWIATSMTIISMLLIMAFINLYNIDHEYIVVMIILAIAAPLLLWYMTAVNTSVYFSSRKYPLTVMVGIFLPIIVFGSIIAIDIFKNVPMIQNACIVALFGIPSISVILLVIWKVSDFFDDNTIVYFMSIICCLFFIFPFGVLVPSLIFSSLRFTITNTIGVISIFCMLGICTTSIALNQKLTTMGAEKKAKIAIQKIRKHFLRRRVDMNPDLGLIVFKDFEKRYKKKLAQEKIMNLKEKEKKIQLEKEAIALREANFLEQKRREQLAKIAHKDNTNRSGEELKKLFKSSIRRIIHMNRLAKNGLEDVRNRIKISEFGEILLGHKLITGVERMTKKVYEIISKADKEAEDERIAARKAREEQARAEEARKKQQQSNKKQTTLKKRHDEKVEEQKRKMEKAKEEFEKKKRLHDEKRQRILDRKEQEERERLEREDLLRKHQNEIEELEYKKDSLDSLLNNIMNLNESVILEDHQFNLLTKVMHATESILQLKISEEAETSSLWSFLCCIGSQGASPCPCYSCFRPHVARKQEEAKQNAIQRKTIFLKQLQRNYEHIPDEITVQEDYEEKKRIRSIELHEKRIREAAEKKALREANQKKKAELEKKQREEELARLLQQDEHDYKHGIQRFEEYIEDDWFDNNELEYGNVLANTLDEEIEMKQMNTYEQQQPAVTAPTLGLFPSIQRNTAAALPSPEIDRNFKIDTWMSNSINMNEREKVPLPPVKRKIGFQLLPPPDKVDELVLSDYVDLGNVNMNNNIINKKHNNEMINNHIIIHDDNVIKPTNNINNNTEIPFLEIPELPGIQNMVDLVDYIDEEAEEIKRMEQENANMEEIEKRKKQKILEMNEHEREIAENEEKEREEKRKADVIKQQKEEEEEKHRQIILEKERIKKEKKEEKQKKLKKKSLKALNEINRKLKDRMELKQAVLAKIDELQEYIMQREELRKKIIHEADVRRNACWDNVASFLGFGEGDGDLEDLGEIPEFNPDDFVVDEIKLDDIDNMVFDDDDEKKKDDNMKHDGEWRPPSWEWCCRVIEAEFIKSMEGNAELNFQFSSANVFALIDLLIEFFTLVMLPFSTVDEWDVTPQLSSLLNISQMQLEPNWKMWQPTFFGFAIISFIYPFMAIPAMRSAKQGTFGKDPKTGKPLSELSIASMYIKLLRLVGSTLYFSIMSQMLQAYVCSVDGAGIMTLTADPSIKCWQGDHWYFVFVAFFVGVLLYYPMASFMFPNMQMLDQSLDVKFEPIFIVIITQGKLFLAGVSSFFNGSQLVLLSAAAASYLLFGLMSYFLQPCLVRPINNFKTGTYAVAFWGCVCSVGVSIMGIKYSAFFGISLASGWLLIIIGTIIYHVHHFGVPCRKKKLDEAEEETKDELLEQIEKEEKAKEEAEEKKAKEEAEEKKSKEEAEEKKSKEEAEEKKAKEEAETEKEQKDDDTDNKDNDNVDEIALEDVNDDDDDIALLREQSRASISKILTDNDDN